MNWDQRPRVFELEGGYPPGPVPAGYVEPPQGQQVVQIIEPARGWWSQAGKFGLRTQLRDDQIIEGQAIALTENLSLPGPPKPLWVQFFRFDRALSSEAAATPNCEFRGRITYGVGGVTNVIECDVMQGIQIPIVCNSINVAVVPYRPNDADVFSAAAVTIGVMFGQGSGGGALPATYTTPFFQQEGAVFDRPFAIPDFARSVCLHTSALDPTDLANCRLFFNIGGNFLKGVNVQALYPELTLEKGIAIPAGTNEISIESDALTASQSFALQFFLAL